MVVLMINWCLLAYKRNDTIPLGCQRSPRSVFFSRCIIAQNSMKKPTARLFKSTFKIRHKHFAVLFICGDFVACCLDAVFFSSSVNDRFLLFQYPHTCNPYTIVHHCRNLARVYFKNNGIEPKKKRNYFESIVTSSIINTANEAILSNRTMYSQEYGT